MKKFLRFVGNPFPTVGVEEEFHLIDPATGELAPRVEEALKDLAPARAGRVSRELFLSVLENQSLPCRGAEELLCEIRRDRRELAAVCRRRGLRLVAAASHPFADWRRERFIPSPHYQWVADRCGCVARRLLAYGLHVHVGMRDAATATYAADQFRRWLYPVMALSVNSPYFEGADSGLASVRAHLMGGMPGAGMAVKMDSFAQVEEYYRKLKATGDVESPGSLWWHLRPQPPLGTVEVRMLDLPTDPERAAAVAAVVQATMAVLQDACLAGEPRIGLDPVYLQENFWRATRDGLEALIVEPATGEVLSMREQLARLFEMIEGKAGELESGRLLKLAREYTEQPGEAAGQREFVGAGHDLRELEMWLAQRTEELA